MPPHKPSPSDEEATLYVEPDEEAPEIAAGVEAPKHEPELNEWERAGVRPPQRFRR